VSFLVFFECFFIKVVIIILSLFRVEKLLLNVNNQSNLMQNEYENSGYQGWDLFIRRHISSNLEYIHTHFAVQK